MAPSKSINHHHPCVTAVTFGSVNKLFGSCSKLSTKDGSIGTNSTNSSDFSSTSEETEIKSLSVDYVVNDCDCDCRGNNDDDGDLDNHSINCNDLNLHQNPNDVGGDKTPGYNENKARGKIVINHEICCLLAEGSPTCFISNFSSMIELYEKIAEYFDISTKEIMYCTLNTPKIDMDQVLCGQICLNDIVFVHRKGRRKEVECVKTELFLGLTIADNGNGCCYIKKIKQNSTASRVPFIQVGDHIESIMGESMVDHRHYEVARFLKMIPLNEIFTMSLVEPASKDVDLRMKTSLIGSSYTSSLNLPPLRRFRFRSNDMVNDDDHECYEGIDVDDGDKDGYEPFVRCPTTANTNNKCRQNNDDADDNMATMTNINKSYVVEQFKLFRTGLFYINKQLEKFIGINDDELAEELWLMAVGPQLPQSSFHINNNNQQKNSNTTISDTNGIDPNNHKDINNEIDVICRRRRRHHRQQRKNPHEFADELKNSDLSDFKFTDDFIFDIWAICNDVLNGTLKLSHTNDSANYVNEDDDDRYGSNQNESDQGEILRNSENFVNDNR